MNFFEDSKRSLRGTGTKIEAPGDQGRKALLGAFASVAMKKVKVIRGHFTGYIVTIRQNRTENLLWAIGSVVSPSAFSHMPSLGKLMRVRPCGRRTCGHSECNQ